MMKHLPSGWVWTTVGETFEVNPPAVGGLADTSPVSFVPMPAVEAMTGRMDTSTVKSFSDVKKGFTPFREGDLLFAKITPSMENGKVAIARELVNGQGFGSTEFHVVSPVAGMSAEYALFFLLQRAVRHEAQANMTGTAGQRRVPTGYFSSISLPLPPLAEQRRIVDEIEKQFTRLDAAVEALRAAQAKLKRYRASVLNAAVTGRLVPTEAELARTEGRGYEHASVLLERIARERRVRWESRNKRPGKYKEPSTPDISTLPELPRGWVWSSIGQVSEVGTGSTPLKSRLDYYAQGTVPWTTSSALNRSKIRTPMSFVTEKAVYECHLSFYPPHTLLVAMYGEGKTRGKCAELVFHSTINQAIAAIVMEESAANCRQYTKVFLESNYMETRRLSSGGVQPNLSLSLVNQIAIPLPPLAEQLRIIAEVDRRLSVFQQAEAAIETNLKRAERLRQAILKRAFEGRLVPQDPDDEPAAVLLERIKTEKASRMREQRGQAGARHARRR